MATQFRVIFLGDRRIAWEAMKLLASPRFRSTFAVQCLVTSEELYRHFVGLSPECGQPEFINNGARSTNEILALIRRRRVNLLLSVQHTWILSPDVLCAVSGMAFNLHNAKLPEYKGYHSISHAIMNGDDCYESTVHWMADEVDSGDVAYVAHTRIDARDTALSLYPRTVDAAIRAFTQLLQDLQAGNPIPRQPLRAGGRFYDKDSIRGIANLSDVRDSREFERRARAAFFPPYNLAYIDIEANRFSVVPAEVLPHEAFGRPINQPNLDMPSFVKTPE